MTTVVMLYADVMDVDNVQGTSPNRLVSGNSRGWGGSRQYLTLCIIKLEHESNNVMNIPFWETKMYVMDDISM